MEALIGIGIGANLGDMEETIRSALERLYASVRGTKFSGLYETMAFPDPSEPPFLNAVLVGFTEHSPEEMLAELKKIEQELGRQSRTRWASREIDLDLLFYNEEIRSDPALSLPHPHLHERDFVLVPLAKVLPSWRHPLLKATPSELLAALDLAKLTVLRRRA